MCGELGGDQLGGWAGQALGLVDSSELLEFGVGVAFEFRAFLGEQCMLAVALAADGDVFAERHRHRPSYEPSQTRCEDRATSRAGACDADHDAGNRDDPVIGAEHAGPQPVESPGDSRAMWFAWVR